MFFICCSDLQSRWDFPVTSSADIGWAHYKQWKEEAPSPPSKFAHKPVLLAEYGTCGVPFKWIGEL